MTESARRLLRLIGDVRGLLALAALMAAAQSAALAPIALIVRGVFDDAIPDRDRAAVVAAAAAVLGLFVVSALLGLVARRVAVRTVKEGVGRLRVELLERVHTLPQSWHDAHDARTLQATIVNDSERLDHLLTQLAASVIPSGLIAVALAAVAAVLEPGLFAVLALVIVALVLAGRLLGQRTRRRVRSWHDALQAYAAGTQTVLRALVLTKVEGAVELEVARGRQQVAHLTRGARALADAQATHSAVQTVLVGIAGVVVLAAGALAVIDGRLSLGDLLAFYAVCVLLLRHVAVVAPGVSSAVVALDALERLDELRRVPDREPYDGRRRIELRGALALVGVEFSRRGLPTLRGVDLHVSPGEHVALLGPNGSGKSTVVELVLGLHRPDRGEVRFDGVPVEELDLPYLRGQLGVVLQDTVLVPGTIAENIAFGRRDATDGQVRAAAEAATAASFIDRLPEGYRTQVGNEAELLSGGQARRIALARALLGDPALLLLDEPSTDLDDESTARVLRNLRALPTAPAVLVVTHDVQVTASVDRVLVLRDGRIT